MKVSELFENKYFFTPSQVLAKLKNDKNALMRTILEFIKDGNVEKARKIMRLIKDHKFDLFSPDETEAINKSIGEGPGGNARHNPTYMHDRKFLLGTSKDWNTLMGVSDKDIAEAMAKIKKTDVFKTLIAKGWNYTSSKIQDKNGTFKFTHEHKIKKITGWGPKTEYYQEYTIYSNGQIRFSNTAADDKRHEIYQIRSSPPSITDGDPVKTLCDTYHRALTLLLKHLEKKQK